MEQRLGKIVMLCAMLTAAASCSVPKRSDFANIPAEGWEYGDYIRYELDDTASRTGDLVLALRHASDYPYADLWVELCYATADTLASDTFHLQLTDGYGRWKGTGIGSNLQYTDTLLRNCVIDLSKPLLLRHLMRTQTLGGIEQIGFIFTAD